MPAVVQQWISTASDEELDAGADPCSAGYWETLTTDGARPLPAFTAETASAWLAAHGLSEGFRVSS